LTRIKKPTSQDLSFLTILCQIKEIKNKLINLGNEFEWIPMKEESKCLVNFPNFIVLDRCAMLFPLTRKLGMVRPNVKNMVNKVSN
jgi:hypothetical protein